VYGDSFGRAGDQLKHEMVLPDATIEVEGSILGPLRRTFRGCDDRRVLGRGRIGRCSGGRGRDGSAARRLGSRGWKFGASGLSGVGSPPPSPPNQLFRNSHLTLTTRTRGSGSSGPTGSVHDPLEAVIGCECESHSSWAGGRWENRRPFPQSSCPCGSGTRGSVVNCEAQNLRRGASGSWSAVRRPPSSQPQD